MVGRLVPLSPAGVLLLFFFVLFAVCGLCFDNLRVLLARVVCLVCLVFLSVVRRSTARPWSVDPGVSGTVVGFPVHPWSCVLLVLRLALSVLFVFLFSALRRVVFVSFFSFAGVARLSCLFIVLGVRGGFSFFLRVCLMPKTCVLPQEAPAAPRSANACPLVSGRSVLFWSLFLFVAFVANVPCARVPVHCMQCARLRVCGPHPLSPPGIICSPAAACFAAQVVRPSPRFAYSLRPSFVAMAEAAQQPNVEGRGRRRHRPQVEGERSVRQRLDDLETRMDTQESKLRGQDQRMLYLEAFTKVVLRGFACVSEFLRAKDQDFKLAKQAFVASFIAELRNQCFAEATHVVDEAETLLCENQGVVVVGVFPTGGHLGPVPDAVLRLQASHAGGRISYLLATAGKYLPESHQCFSDRVKRDQREKGMGKGKGKEKKGGGKGKFKAPQPKRAAGPANPQG